MSTLIQRGASTRRPSEKPAKPAKPAKATKTDEAAKNATAGKNAKSATAGKNAKNATAGKDAKSATAGKNAKSTKSATAGKNAKSTKNATAGKDAKSAKRATAGRSAKSATAGRSAKTAKTTSDVAREPEPRDGRTRRRLETRERVRQAAFELFVRQGFDATTTSAIARRAGVAAGTVFLHASDKADLLFLVMHDRLEAVVDSRVRDLPEGPLLDRLMHLFDGLFRMYGEHPDLTAAFVRHLPGADGPNARRVSTLTFAFLHRLAMLVVDAQRRGEVASDVDLLTCSRNVFGLYFASLLTWLSGHVTLEGALVPTLRDSLALQIRGLRV